MPFDPLPSPASERPALRPELRPVARWLFVLCGMVLVMVTLGGATRLTGSGLSIMEWAPIMGTVPPLSDAEWQRLFVLYQKTSQYDILNNGFGISGFKSIFWLEWVHRFWGRLMGLVLLAPLAWFAVRGLIGRSLLLRMAGLLVLGGLQGGVGWFMVASGFEAERTAVSPYRLVMHLSLAVALYAALLWTALGVRQAAHGPVVGLSSRAMGRLSGATVVLVGLTILAGGFVAGLHAGLTYNSFPFMDGRIVPAGYALLHPVGLNFVENIATVQFNHRLLATLTTAAALAAALVGARRATGAVRLGAVVLGAAVAGQYGLGVATLLWAVPVGLGTAHQAMAMLVLTSALVLLHLHRAAALHARPDTRLRKAPG